jgi:hypothetical protein
MELPRCNSKHDGTIEADYRPRPGATLTVNSQRYALTLSQKVVSAKFDQVRWLFSAVPITTAVGESAHRGTIRYSTKRGRQTLKAAIFADTCV